MNFQEKVIQQKLLKMNFAHYIGWNQVKICQNYRIKGKGLFLEKITGMVVGHSNKVKDLDHLKIPKSVS